MKVRLIKENKINDIQAHLKERGIDLSKTRVILDKESNVATFLIYNLSGQLIGYQYYNPNGDKNTVLARQKMKSRQFKNEDDIASLKDFIKYYTRISNFQKGVAVYGLETYNKDSDILFVTEGIFDCNKIHEAGLPAIATLTNAGSNELITWLRMLPQKIVAILDNDESGGVLKKISDYSYNTPKGYKDLGECPQEIVNEYISKIVDELKNKPKIKGLQE